MEGNAVALHETVFLVLKALTGRKTSVLSAYPEAVEMMQDLYDAVVDAEERGDEERLKRLNVETAELVAGLRHDMDTLSSYLT